MCTFDSLTSGKSALCYQRAVTLEIKTLRFARRTAKWAPGADGKSGRGVVRVFFSPFFGEGRT